MKFAEKNHKIVLNVKDLELTAYLKAVYDCEVKNTFIDQNKLVRFEIKSDKEGISMPSYNDLKFHFAKGGQLKYLEFPLKSEDASA